MLKMLRVSKIVLITSSHCFLFFEEDAEYKTVKDLVGFKPHSFKIKCELVKTSYKFPLF